MVSVISPDVAELLVYASVHSPFWRERLKDKPFAEISVLKKGELPAIQQQKLPFGGLLTVPEYEAARIFLSPGPIYDVQGTDGDFWRFAEALEVAGFGPGDIVQNTFSYHLSPAGMMFDAALRKLGATVIPAGIGNTELQVQVLRDCRVTGYVGTPSFLATLLERAGKEEYQFGHELKLNKAFFTAEKLAPALRRVWQEAGLSVFEGYGTADAGLIAYEDGVNPGLKVAASVYLEICDPETGKPLPQGADGIGEVIVTVLDKTYPLIRFGTGDLSSWLPGQEGKYISGVLGRVGDGVKVKGMFVHLKQFAPILENTAWVSYYQAVVTREDNSDRFTLYLESEALPGAGEDLLKSLQDELRERIRIRPHLQMVAIGILPRKEPQLIDKRRWE
ncbi:MAG: AMP-binding protein [Desulfitobacteriaceae bacterium]|nr:AMP-binding protein [Desulfitobacteriaceae bacterium]MDI6915560.1 AMP-binding protein [Desulfitobacteriaceae bacterium]